jgi:hypothetical protein
MPAAAAAAAAAAAVAAGSSSSASFRCNTKPERIHQWSKRFARTRKILGKVQATALSASGHAEAVADESPPPPTSMPLLHKPQNRHVTLNRGRVFVCNKVPVQNPRTHPCGSRLSDQSVNTAWQ